MELISTRHSQILSLVLCISGKPFHWMCSSKLQEKTFTQDELAEMLSCNLAEIVHNKWLQASRNKGGDLYLSALDDYIQAFF